MQVHKSSISATRTKLTLQADQELLESVKVAVLQRLRREVKMPGFRAGKVPLELVEKNIDQSTLQSQFIDDALNRMYGQALQQERLRPVAQPTVNVTKFVPFTTLEFEAEVETVGDVTLPDYDKVKVAKKSVKIADKDVQEVIENLKLRMAEKEDVDRAAKDKDEVWIDFEGKDAKTAEPIQGADGKDYPLVLGSNTFIPGFEPNLVGLKAGEQKQFDLEFPKEYGVAALQGRSVTFNVTVNKVQKVVLPKEDDEFAAKAGPFKSLADLKDDIKKQLTAEREYQNERDFESDVLSKITEDADVAIPDALVDEELDRLEREERQNLVYRGQNWEEHLAAEGVTDEEHRAKNRPGAELRVKAGLVLAEIAEKEQVNVTPEELQSRIAQLKQQYTDAAMQAELDKPENQREIASRILSEKTIALLADKASKNVKQAKATSGASADKKPKA